MDNFRLLSTKILSSDLQKRLIQTGVTLSSWNFIEVTPKSFSVEMKNQALIFTSQNAVKATLSQQSFQSYKCYCVGEKTKALLEKMGQKVIKSAKNASLLADFIIKNIKNETFIFFTGTLRMSEIEKKFKQHQLPLTVVETYQTFLTPKAVGEPDGILFFSPSGVASYLQKNRLGKSQCFAIGTTTEEALRPYSESIITANKPTVEHLISAVRKHLTTLV